MPTGTCQQSKILLSREREIGPKTYQKKSIGLTRIHTMERVNTDMRRASRILAEGCRHLESSGSCESEIGPAKSGQEQTLHLYFLSRCDIQLRFATTLALGWQSHSFNSMVRCKSKSISLALLRGQRYRPSHVLNGSAKRQFLIRLPSIVLNQRISSALNLGQAPSGERLAGGHWH